MAKRVCTTDSSAAYDTTTASSATVARGDVGSAVIATTGSDCAAKDSTRSTTSVVVPERERATTAS